MRGYFHGNHAGTALAFVSTVRLLCSFARAVLMMMPIVTCAARIHAHIVDAPEAITQEVNQCLRLVNVAASRRPTSPVAARPRPDRQTRII
jgi:hypothetical protein